MNKLEFLKINKKFYEYLSQGKYADEQFICDIIEIAAKYRGYNSMIHSVIVSNEAIQDGSLGFYSLVEKELNIVLPDNNKEVFNYNINILHTILHELEHVEQHKKRLKKGNSFESGLYSACFQPNEYCQELEKRLDSGDVKPSEYLAILSQMEYYTKYAELVNKKCYELLPSERHAEINSFAYLLKILSKNKDNKYFEDIEKAELNYLLRKIFGYKKIDGNVSAPTYELYRIILEFMKKPELIQEYYDKFDYNSKNMNLEERLYYGMKISKNEYENHMEKIQKKLLKLNISRPDIVC